jgi:hypothetical protein
MAVETKIYRYIVSLTPVLPLGSGVETNTYTKSHKHFSQYGKIQYMK